MLPKTIEMLSDWTIIEYDPFRGIDIDKSITHLKNPNYIGGDVKVFYGPSHKIKRFIYELYRSEYSKYLNYIDEIRVEFYSSIYRGSSCGRGFIKADKTIFEPVIFEHWFQYIDKAFGHWNGAFEYELSRLCELKDIVDY